VLRPPSCRSAGVASWKRRPLERRPGGSQFIPCGSSCLVLMMSIPESPPEQLAENLRQRLAAQPSRAANYRRFVPELSYGRHRGPAGPGAKPAAVVALFYPACGQWRLPLTVRPASMSDHAGQICLPGGGMEPGEGASSCALRELREELGVDSAAVQVLGSLPPIFVYASNFLVRPFVALAPERPSFQPDPREVAELVELPWPHLIDGRNHRSRAIVRGPLSFQAPGIVYQDHHIWGATALILGELLEVLDVAATNGRGGLRSAELRLR
jgi:8-oxo-dGTP pyrophosphatase MutT (NUDIX family)